MFYYFKAYIVEISKEKNPIGQTIDKFKLSTKKFDCDLQAGDIGGYATKIITNGKSDIVNSLYTLFADENLIEGNYISINNELFKVVKKADWGTHKEYLIEGSKEVVAVEGQ